MAKLQFWNEGGIKEDWHYGILLNTEISNLNYSSKIKKKFKCLSCTKHTDNSGNHLIYYAPSQNWQHQGVDRQMQIQLTMFCSEAT